MGVLYVKERLLFYPASGLRVQTSGAFNNTGANGYYWSCAPNGANTYYLNFNNTNVNPINNTNRAYGFAVRCVQYLLLLGACLSFPQKIYDGLL